jgi:hypothetical protein
MGDVVKGHFRRSRLARRRACKAAKESTVIQRTFLEWAKISKSRQCSPGILPRDFQQETDGGFNPSASATALVPRASITSAVDSMIGHNVFSRQTSQGFARKKPAKRGQRVEIEEMIDKPHVVGMRLATLRKVLGYRNMTVFAKALGLGKSIYSLIENGHRPLSLTTADRLRSKHKIPLDYTFYGDESGLTQNMADRLRNPDAA